MDCKNTMKVISPNIEQILAIRHKVLWPDKPVDFSRVEGDESALHFGLEHRGQVVCVASVYIDASKASARLRKFATLPAYQGQGFGSHLLKAMLADCQQRGLQHFWCDARESAIGFYRRFGMSTQGERFYKETVQYFTMAIALGDGA